MNLGDVWSHRSVLACIIPARIDGFSINFVFWDVFMDRTCLLEQNFAKVEMSLWIMEYSSERPVAAAPITGCSGKIDWKEPMYGRIQWNDIQTRLPTLQG